MHVTVKLCTMMQTDCVHIIDEVLLQHLKDGMVYDPKALQTSVVKPVWYHFVIAMLVVTIVCASQHLVPYVSQGHMDHGLSMWFV